MARPAWLAEMVTMAAKAALLNIAEAAEEAAAMEAVEAAALGVPLVLNQVAPAHRALLSFAIQGVDKVC